MEAKRLIYNDLCDNLASPEVAILLGARQVGKTYLLRKIEAYAQSQGKSTAYFNLELPDDLLKFSRDESETFRLLTTTAEVLFIDEFHYLKNASHLFKAVYDSSHSVKIFASGSSSLEIHKHLKESLAGRRRLFRIYPLSLDEYRINTLPYEGVLCEGSLPGLLHKKTKQEKIEYVHDLIETYILKDIKALIKEENVRAFNQLLYLLAEWQGSVVATASLARELGLTAASIERYLTILEQTYVCFSLPSFSTNQANELKKSRKYYFFDIGIRNALVKNFQDHIETRTDKGFLYESAVFLYLLQRVSPETALFFWRTKQKEEVDFVRVTNRKPVPIEVKTDGHDMQIPAGITAFLRRYPNTEKAYVVNTTITGEKAYNGIPVYFVHWTDMESGADPGQR